MSVDPRLRVAFLLGTAVGVFFLRQPWQLAIALAALIAGWFVVRLPARRLLRQLYKLWGLATFIAVSYLLFDDDGNFGFRTDNLVQGTVMFARIVAIILASHLARAGDPRAVAAGLTRLRVPEPISVPIDTVLALLGGDERHDGTGGGRGRNRKNDEESGETFFQAVKRIARGDVGPIARRLELQIDRAERHIHRETKSARTKDLAVIAGIALTMLGIKALKVLPSIPFAPGHKLVLLTPLYIIVRRKTQMRGAATLTGLTMGSVAFLMGDGKYGVFEILKHLAPGLICDLFQPKDAGPIGWSIFGGLIAVARFATIFCVTMLIQAPGIAYAMLIPGLTVHLTFGVASGFVTHHLVRAMQTKE